MRVGTHGWKSDDSYVEESVQIAIVVDLFLYVYTRGHVL